MIDAVGVVNHRYDRLVAGHFGERFFRVEIADPQIAQANHPEGLALDVGDGRFVLQKVYTFVPHRRYHAVKLDVILFAGSGSGDTVIVIAQAGVNAVPAFDLPDQFDGVLPEFSGDVMRYIIAGHHDDIRFERVDPVDAPLEIAGADGPAAVDVADLDDAFAGKFLGKSAHRHIDVNDLDPFPAGPFFADRRRGTETHLAERDTFQVPRVVSYFFRFSFYSMHSNFLYPNP